MGSDGTVIDKRTAALSSVWSAVFLTTLKVVVGLLSGSLGILAEAAHSGLDFIAALVTYLAVHFASKPADREHLYGHGKVENLSALFETLLLLVTCVWIVNESVERLGAKDVKVDASIWAFGVMIVSIIVDVSRARMLYRAAKAHNSQALEADALHFSTDIWSSAVVIMGLVGVKIAALNPALAYLKKADAVAALLVAAIVIWVSLQLGYRTVMALLDSAPHGMAEQIKAKVEAIEGVMDCHAVRIRPSGPQYFVDVHVTVNGDRPLREVHALTDRIEEAIQEITPRADVTVHPEPAEEKPS